MEAANWPMFKLDVKSFDGQELNNSKLLLEMLSRGSNMSQILLDDGNEIKLLTLNNGMMELEITEPHIGTKDAIKRLQGTDIPLVVQDENGKFGILTKADFDDHNTIGELCKLVLQDEVEPELKHQIVEHIIRVGAEKPSSLEI